MHFLWEYLSDCPGSTKESDQPSHPTQTHCKTVTSLTPNPTWRMDTFTRLIRQMLYTVQYTFNTLFCTSLFCLSLHIFTLFSEKITSACKKLKKESEHKNFLYTYSWTCHVLLIQMQVIICKNKNIEILQINYKPKFSMHLSPHNQNI